MTITYYPELIQGSDEWMAARCGLITAGSMDLIITPTLKMASNDKERTHLYELLAQRVTGYVEPQYVNDEMLRGLENEIYAREVYSEKYGPTETTGLVINDELGFDIGFSPDWLVGKDGFVEMKSRRQKYQAQAIIEGIVPVEFMLQVQTGLFVTGRKWCDFISWHGGMPMFVCRSYPEEKYQQAIVAGAIAFEERLQAAQKKYETAIVGMPMTERRIEKDIVV